MPSRRSLRAWISSIRRASSVRRDVVAEAVRGRVVGDRDVLQAALARRQRHLLGGLQPVRGGRVHVQVALEVRQRRSDRAARPRAPPRARRGPRAARAGSTAARAARRPPPRSRSAASRRTRRRGSRTRRCAGPRRTALSRSATLWALEPVKCWSTLPNWSGSTTLRSIFMPVCVVTRAPASPEDCTDSTSSSSPSVRASAFGSLAVAMMSRSLTESARRRSEPATSTRSLAGCARSAVSTSSAIASARESTTRGAGPPAAS